ncbi:MAG: hypothetical protein M3083_12370 [Actinomycetota bacterium]|nr:hypothetical protein [Actinomycetota bacterium]
MSDAFMPASPSGPPETIVLIRHGEKPTIENKAPFGVDINGNQNFSSLLPVGWQRAGALSVLFRPSVGPLTVPNRLYSPNYGTKRATTNHRTYETIVPLMDRLNLQIHNPFKEGQEEKLAKAIVAHDSGTSLVCWEHTHIPVIAANIPVAQGQDVPTAWPGDRFDVIWLFALATATPTYTFAQLPQLLMSRDLPI